MLRVVVVVVASSFVTSADELADKQRDDTRLFKIATSKASSSMDLWLINDTA